jgi:glycosyltransferase involved in cell wall biosynthesis
LIEPEHHEITDGYMESLALDRAEGVGLESRAGLPPTIGIIALSAIADDPRVRRQGDAFSKAGWNVIGIGLPGAYSQPPEWLRDIAGCGELSADRLENTWVGAGEDALALPRSARLEYVKRIARSMGLTPVLRTGLRRARQVRYVLRMQAPRISSRFAEAAYWPLNTQFTALRARAEQYKADVWLANDWTALPIARRLAHEQGAALVYDTHELASDEYAERLRWRILHRPLVVALERECLEKASLVTCVSDGIADRLTEIYKLPERPLVVRNTPSYQEMPFRRTGGQVEVLYHGIVSRGRGLEECIRSVALWRPEFRLTIRGPGPEEYRALLNREIAAAGVRDRVRIVSAVPMTALVREANAFDVGLFALPDHSRHNRFALPNKFFEYTMAGLALCVSDLPEMARLVRQSDLGTLISGMTPQAIAAAVNSLTRDSIDHHKQAALLAARQLNWERESDKLVSRCAAAAAARR